MIPITHNNLYVELTKVQAPCDSSVNPVHYTTPTITNLKLNNRLTTTHNHRSPHCSYAHQRKRNIAEYGQIAV